MSGRMLGGRRRGKKEPIKSSTGESRPVVQTPRELVLWRVGWLLSRLLSETSSLRAMGASIRARAWYRFVLLPRMVAMTTRGISFFLLSGKILVYRSHSPKLHRPILGELLRVGIMVRWSTVVLVNFS